MKHLLFLFLFSLLSLTTGRIEAEEIRIRKIENRAFREGEVLKFKLHYGFINAGVGELRVMDRAVNVGGKECLHVVATGRSINSFDWFFKVRDRFETYIDKQAMVPWKFAKDVYEGGYAFKDDYRFDHHANLVHVNEKKQFQVPQFTQDIVSSFYFARTLDFKNARKGDTFEVPMFMDNELHRFKFRFTGREIIDLGVGKFRVMVFMPLVMKGRVFKNEEDLIVYVSDDENKIPLQIKANILIGSVKMTITEYSGLRNPLTSKIN
ncbi:MAG: DUF3108 domain-containing protein [Sphingobacteriaceae bacterium]|nr:DUF3108 domain-containing protein [Sphingobacteriaceae bacterium]